MASRLFHALVVAGSSMAGSAALEGCGNPPLRVPDGGSDLAGWPQISTPDLAGWNMIDAGWPPISPPDFATGDLRDAAWWPDIHMPFVDFAVRDMSWWPDIGMPPDFARHDFGWVMIDIGIPRG